MKFSATKFGLTILGLLALLPPARAETDQEVAARRVAFDVAGAFSNDGFKLRDGHWTGTLAPHASKLFAVNLYGGNQYWFSVGATDEGKRLTIELFDETGAPVATDKFQADGKAAAGVSIASSGQYFVRVGLEEGAPAGICFVYSYK